MHDASRHALGRPLKLPGSPLTGVECVFYSASTAEAASEERHSPWIETVVFRFNQTAIRVAVDGDTDELVVEVQPSPLFPAAQSVSAIAPWRGLIGRSLLWSWQMVNNQGYEDGWQFEFAARLENENPATVQLVAIASEIHVAVVDRYLPREALFAGSTGE